MSELIYKLNLPPLPDILLPEVVGEMLTIDPTADHKLYDPVNVLKPEWLEFNGFKWDHIQFFYKDNRTGIIHSDGPTAWGINWIHNGYGTMEYWHREDVRTTIDYPLGERRFRHTSDAQPFVTYKTPPGAYLVNAAVPHRASGFNSRWAFSLRVYKQRPVPWPELIERFKDYIIGGDE